jgi:hypothetical protein
MIKYLISNLVITISFFGIISSLQVLYLLGRIDEITTITCITMLYVYIAYAYGLSVKYLKFDKKK